MSFDLVLERESANDVSATVVALHVASGATVAPGDLLLEVETSKAVQEVTAPQGGTILHDLEVGREVGYGEVLARILAPGEAREAPPAPPAAATGAEPAPETPERTPAGVPDGVDQPPPLRVSRAAAALMAELGIAADQFAAGFITTAEVRALSAAPPAPPAERPSPESAPEAAGGEPVSSAKRREIDALSAGAGQTMLSVLGVELGAIHVPREAGDLLGGRITDLVIYEASRLMRKFPRLNAAYADGRVQLHPAICAGLAIDGGGRLVVFGIADSDKIELAPLGGVIADAVERYSLNQLTSAELTRATFTVTDLSAHPLDFVLPLLPRGQSCIIGVTRGPDEQFRLRAGFDHRVTEGAEVALFLGELRERLMSFGVAAARAAEPACGCCGRTASEAVGQFKEKGLLRVVNGRGEEGFCCASCWNGW
jgi:pyruvate/2-oxoglutarate dehydrogenase complex dihydrolipoamide acyltransferase (E2) component